MGKTINEHKMEEQRTLPESQYENAIKLAVIKTKERERNRISRELHDNVNQLLLSSKLFLDMANKNKERQAEFLQKTDEYLGMAIEEIKLLTQKLNTTIVTYIGLEGCLKNISLSFSIKDINLETNIKAEVAEILAADQLLMVYRIIQEQTNNILKHANAKKVVISLTAINHQVELEIIDDGKGFDPEIEKSTGFGFINMQDRVSAFKGEIEIKSSPLAGCTLIIRFPFPLTSDI